MLINKTNNNSLSYNFSKTYLAAFSTIFSASIYAEDLDILMAMSLEDLSAVEVTVTSTAKKTNHCQGEMNQLCKDGSYIPLFVRINKIENSRSHEIQTVIIASDLRSLKEVQRLEFLANHDRYQHRLLLCF